MENSEFAEANLKRFGILDYTVFAGMLAVSGMIGVYFGFIKKSASKTEYLVGGRNMSIFPIAMSLVATWVSGISLLGIPTEIYLYGVSYTYFIFSFIISAAVMHYGYLPVFLNLKLTSTYEYLEMRFDNKVRLFGSLLFAISNITWLPIVIYVPALAFNQVTGVNIHLVTPIVCVVCIFYTCVGGLKAVVWTDVVQSTIMYGSILLIMIKGTIDLGGFSVVWKRNYDADRLEPPLLSLDMTERYTLWSTAIGGFIHLLTSNSILQTMMQRYFCLPSLNHARKALWLYTVCVSFLLLSCCYCGALIFATYYNCDPLTTKVARAKDQLLPMLAIDILEDYPGAPGLFLSAVFSAALSSLSSGLNSVTAVVREDFYKIFSDRPLTEKQSDIFMKSVVVVVGATCVVLVFVVEKLSTVLQLSATAGAMSLAPSLGVFTIGMFNPWVTAKAALWGGLSGLGFMGWLCIGAQTALANGQIIQETKPLTTEGCTYNFTYVAPNLAHFSENDGFPLYKVSYLWYSTLGTLVTMAMSVIFNILLSKDDSKPVDTQLLSPIIQPFIKNSDFERKYEQSLKNGYKYSSVELQTVKTENRTLSNSEEYNNKNQTQT